MAATVASATHFFVKLVFAAPASFFSAAWASQVFVASAFASFSHFFPKLFLAVPDQTDRNAVTVRVVPNGVKQWPEGGFVTEKPRR